MTPRIRKLRARARALLRQHARSMRRERCLWGRWELAGGDYNRDWQRAHAHTERLLLLWVRAEERLRVARAAP